MIIYIYDFQRNNKKLMKNEYLNEIELKIDNQI